MREGHLRWFGHIQSRAINVLVSESGLIQVEGKKRGRGRQKITSIEVVKNGMSIKSIKEYDFR